jgi:hypothetical protein
MTEAGVIEVDCIHTLLFVSSYGYTAFKVK